MRPLALSVASGSLSSLLFAVARDLARSDLVAPPAEVCPLFAEDSRHSGFDLNSILLGIFIGLLLGPILDAFYLFRQGLLRSAAGTFAFVGSSRPHYRVLNEPTRGSGTGS